MSATPPPIQTVTHISVEITPGGGSQIGGSDGMDQLLFSSCSPPDWSIEAPKHIFHGNSGTPQPIISSVQNPTYGTMTLTQGWDPQNVLAHWMNQISDPSVAMDQKKAQVTVVFMDSTGSRAVPVGRHRGPADGLQPQPVGRQLQRRPDDHGDDRRGHVAAVRGGRHHPTLRT